MGPVQVLVIGLDEPTFGGEVATELAELQDAGIVRLVDALVVTRPDDRTFETVDVAGLPTNGALVADLLGGAGDEPDDPDGEHLWSLGAAVPVGSAAVIALIEHVWAGPLRDAIQRAGGVTLDETWLTAGDAGRLEALMAARR
jgi:hypothetical protein